MNPKNLGLSLAIVSGGFWFVAMTLALTTGIGDVTVKGVGALHPWFDFSWIGMVVMVAQHLIGGFILGYAIAWVYNKAPK